MTYGEELLDCPACGRLSRHRVVRERVLAPAVWCQVCFVPRYLPAEPALHGNEIRAESAVAA